MSEFSLRFDAAVEDLNDRTLAGLPGQFARLVYLSSTRDFNSGYYRHDGLAFTFGEDVAHAALSASHITVFERIIEAGLEILVRDLYSYFSSTVSDVAQAISSWKTMQIYRLLTPPDCEGLIKRFFLGNVEVALLITQKQFLEDASKKE